MNNLYDEIIIGSGPSCLGFVLGRKKPKKTLIISSESIDLPSNISKSKIHPKLIVHQKLIVLPEFNYFGETSNLGGLSSAWGGLLFKPNLNESTFRKPSSYNTAFNNILKFLSEYFYLYKLEKNSFNLITKFKKISIFESAFYLIDSRKKYSWENSGINLFKALNRTCSFLKIKIIKDRVISIQKNDMIWIIKTAKKNYYANRLVLAGGAISNKKILTDFDPEFKKIQLFDHTPLKIFALYFSCDQSQLKGSSSPLKIILRGKNFFYACYALNKLTRKFLRKNGLFGFLLSFMPNFFIKRFYLIQLWNRSTKDFIFHSKPKKSKHNNLFKLFSFLLNIGFLSLFFSKTRPGEGFHYMSDTDSVKLHRILSRHSNLTILGGFANNISSIEPPSLTFMADAYVKGSSQ